MVRKVGWTNKSVKDPDSASPLRKSTRKRREKADPKKVAEANAERLRSGVEKALDRATEKLSKAPRASQVSHVDLASECPVCRSLAACACTETDRAFVRRVRFESDVSAVARCPRCRSPLSVIYVRRPGSIGDSLSGFAAIWACVFCAPATICAAANGAGAPPQEASSEPEADAPRHS